MQPDAVGNFQNLSPNGFVHPSTPSLNESNASPYQFLPDHRHLPQMPSDNSPKTNTIRQYTDMSYNDKHADSPPTGYPESSQRTVINDVPYSSSQYAISGHIEDLRDSQRRGYGVLSKDRIHGSRPPESSRNFPEPMSARPNLFLYPSEAVPRPPQRQSSFLDEGQYAGSSSNPYPGQPNSSASSGIGSSQLVPQTIDFELGHRSPNQFDTAFLLPSGGTGDTFDHQAYRDANVQDSLFMSEGMIHTSHSSSIPMRKTPGWVSPIPGSFDPSIAQYNPRDPDSDASVSVGVTGSHVGYSTPDTALSSSSATSSSSALTATSTTGRKKKSKMHDCEICGKSFPRCVLCHLPHILYDRQSTTGLVASRHIWILITMFDVCLAPRIIGFVESHWFCIASAAFPCGYPGCQRSFTVRSNAKRHLRTHGVELPPSAEPSVPYVVGFSTPTVLPSSSTSAEQLSDKAPYKVRWMPPSLTTRTNAGTLSSLSDAESDSGDEDWRSALPIPIPRVFFPHAHDPHFFQESSHRGSNHMPSFAMSHLLGVLCDVFATYHVFSISLFWSERQQKIWVPRFCSISRHCFKKPQIMKFLWSFVFHIKSEQVTCTSIYTYGPLLDSCNSMWLLHTVVRIQWAAVMNIRVDIVNVSTFLCIFLSERHTFVKPQYSGELWKK